jgi:hypothetical protein
MSSPPEDRQPRSDDPDASPRSRPRRARRGPPDPAAGDEKSVLHSPLLAAGEPDSLLVGFSSWDLAKVAAIQAERPIPGKDPTSGLDVGVDLASSSDVNHSRVATAAEPTIDWPRHLLMSYASAVTLGLVWLFWSGKLSPPPPRPAAAPTREVLAPRRRVVDPAPPVVAANRASRSTVPTVPLGKSIVVDGVEVTPLLVLRQGTRLVRDLGEESLVREHDDCLALTIRLKNLSVVGEAPRPIVAEDLADGDDFAIDVPSGPPIAMFALAPGLDWEIEGQSFPAVPPGESADVVLLSEPLGGRRLPPGMTWRLRVATDPERTRFARLGVTFGPNDIP